MSRFRLVLLSMLAVMAVAAVASASASAHEYIVPCHPVLAANIAKSRWEDAACTKPKAAGGFDTRLFPGEVAKVTGTSGESILKSELSGVAITIKCKKDKFAGTLGAEGKSSATTITYEECKLTGSFESKCEVEETLKTNTLKGELTGTRIEDKFEPESGNFIEIVIKAKSGKTCSIASTYPITGNQKCEADKSNTEAMTMKEEHELICKASGSSLKLGPEPATYEGTATVKLEGGGNWAIE